MKTLKGYLNIGSMICCLCIWKSDQAGCDYTCHTVDSHYHFGRYVALHPRSGQIWHWSPFLTAHYKCSSEKFNHSPGAPITFHHRSFDIPCHSFWWCQPKSNYVCFYDVYMIVSFCWIIPEQGETYVSKCHTRSYILSIFSPDLSL